LRLALAHHTSIAMNSARLLGLLFALALVIGLTLWWLG
jgi:hypothetical protein